MVDDNDNDDNEKYQKIEKQKRQFQSNATKIILLIVLFGIGQFVALVWYSEEGGGDIKDKVQSELSALMKHESSPKDDPNNKLLLRSSTSDKNEEEAAVKTDAEEKPKDNDGGKDYSQMTLDQLEAEWTVMDAKVREIKGRVDIFETDPEGQKNARLLQDITRQLLYKRYGTNEPYKIEIVLEFPQHISDYYDKGPTGKIVVEMGPSKFIPVSIYNFMEMARSGAHGGFHRRAGHVLQAHLNGKYANGKHYQHLPFQEYSPEYPHKERTIGYAGRPSGPGWYVSIKDNSRNHGPGSQQKHNPYEADACIGKVVEGYEDVVIARIRKLPCDGFCKGNKDEIKITEMNIMVKPSEVSEYVAWSEA